MIKTLMENWDVIGISGAVVVMFGWGFSHLLKFVTGLIKGQLKDLATSHTKNAIIQERIASSLDRHEMASKERDETTLKILKNTLNLSNGGNPAVKKCMEDIDTLFKMQRGEKK